VGLGEQQQQQQQQQLLVAEGDGVSAADVDSAEDMVAVAAGS
jgi:hypothetical protein